VSQRPLIKICGVMDKTTAYQVAALGADFVGIVCSGLSKRKVTARAIPEPVAVVTHHNSNDMRSLCDKAKINYVQLHSHFAIKQGRMLPAYIKRIPVIQIDNSRHLPLSAEHREPYEAYVLIDGAQPGIGRSQHLTNLSALPPNRRYIIAGGLKPANVGAYVSKLCPEGVDVATGVERASGVKDLSQVRAFIQTVRCNGVMSYE